MNKQTKAYIGYVSGTEIGMCWAGCNTYTDNTTMTARQYVVHLCNYLNLDRSEFRVDRKGNIFASRKAIDAHNKNY